MAMTPEKKIKKQVVEVLNGLGVYHFFPATYGMGRSGIPDIVGCVGGRFIAIECKAGDKTPTALQLREIDRIRQVGGIALVVNEKNIDILKGTIKLLL